MIWGNVSQPMTIEHINSGAFIGTQSWKTQTECEFAAAQAMRIISRALESKGTRNPVILGQCIEHTPGQDV